MFFEVSENFSIFMERSRKLRDRRVNCRLNVKSLTCLGFDLFFVLEDLDDGMK